MRTFMVNAVIPNDETARQMNGAFWGCDICQRICPMNRKDVTPMPNALKKLLKIDDFLKSPEKHSKALAGYIGENYADKNRLLALCLSAAGNSGDKAYIPLIEKHLTGKSENVVKSAERALRFLS